MSTAWVTVGLQWGDEGKGKAVDWLCRRLKPVLVVRYSGGAQAEHNVVTPEGLHHGFHQWGSGTFAGIPTLLGRHVFVDPEEMLKEAEQLECLGVPNPWKLLTVDPRCPVLTPWHSDAGLYREASRSKRHGSCGYGVGEAARDMASGRVLRWGDLRSSDAESLLGSTIHRLKQRLPRWTPPDDREWLAMARDCAISATTLEDDVCVSLCNGYGDVVLEGAQGVLLDEWHGFHPHTTWSTVTAANARDLLAAVGWEGDRQIIGVTRAHSIRHGFGPIPTATRTTTDEEEPHNGDDGWAKGRPRRGPLDLVLANYAAEVLRSERTPIDRLVVTHLDELPAAGEWECCVRYASGWVPPVLFRPDSSYGKPTEALPADHVARTERLARSLPHIRRVLTTEAREAISWAFRAPIWLESTGPTWKQTIEHEMGRQCLA